MGLKKKLKHSRFARVVGIGLATAPIAAATVPTYYAIDKARDERQERGAKLERKRNEELAAEEFSERRASKLADIEQRNKKRRGLASLIGDDEGTFG